MTLRQCEPEEILPDGISLCRCLLVPAHSFGLIGRYTKPSFIGQPKVALGDSQPPLRRKSEPADRLGLVRGNTKSFLEEIAHEVLALRIASVGFALAGSISVGIFTALLGSFGSLKICQRWPWNDKEEQQRQDGPEPSRECCFREGDRIAISFHGVDGKVKARRISARIFTDVLIVAYCVATAPYAELNDVAHAASLLLRAKQSH
jgi:hypothetical protein